MLHNPANSPINGIFQVAGLTSKNTRTSPGPSPIAILRFFADLPQGLDPAGRHVVLGKYPGQCRSENAIFGDPVPGRKTAPGHRRHDGQHGPGVRLCDGEHRRNRFLLRIQRQNSGSMQWR